MAPRKKKETTIGTNGVFDDLHIYVDEDETPTEKPKLDIFKQVLPALNRGDYSFYDKLSPAEKKLYQPYVIFRWLSGNSGVNAVDYIQNVNEFVNVDFWNLSGEHAELQHMLMCMSARLSNGFSTKNQRHEWIAFLGGKRKKSAVNDFLLSKFPQLHDNELDLWKKVTTVEQFSEFLDAYGVQDTEHKNLMKLYKAEKKAGA